MHDLLCIYKLAISLADLDGRKVFDLKVNLKKDTTGITGAWGGGRKQFCTFKSTFKALINTKGFNIY